MSQKKMIDRSQASSTTSVIFVGMVGFTAGVLIFSQVPGPIYSTTEEYPKHDYIALLCASPVDLPASSGRSEATSDSVVMREADLSPFTVNEIIGRGFVLKT